MSSGILEYGTLGQLHSVDFHKMWILNRACDEAEFLTVPESSTLIDYASRMRMSKNFTNSISTRRFRRS